MPDFQKQMVPYFSTFDEEVRHLEYNHPAQYIELDSVFMGLMERLGVGNPPLGPLGPWGDF